MMLIRTATVKRVATTGAMHAIDVTLPGRAAVSVSRLGPQEPSISNDEAIRRAESYWAEEDWKQQTGDRLREQYPDAAIIVEDGQLKALKITNKGKISKVYETATFQQPWR